MPNHVTISMLVRGTKEEIESFVANHVDGETLSLESFIPMPAELRGTTAPANPPRDASPMVLAQWKKNQERLVELYGYDNWYDWAVNERGTKWDCYDGSMTFGGDTEVVLNFQTAWSLPEPVFNKMFELYGDTMDFHIKCVEEGGYFSGTIAWLAGELFDDITDDQETWKEFADELLGYDFDENGDIV